MLKLSFYDNKGRMVNDVKLLPITDHEARKIVSEKTFQKKLDTYIQYAKQFEHKGKIKTEMKMVMNKWNDDYSPIFYIS